RSSTMTPTRSSEAPSRLGENHFLSQAQFARRRVQMVDVRAVPLRAPVAAPSAPAAVEFRYTQTESFVALLRQLGVSLLVSTYQANKLLVARAAAAGLSMLVRTFERPMGLAADAKRLAIGTRNQIWLLRNAPDIAPQVEPAGQH